MSAFTPGSRAAKQTLEMIWSLTCDSGEVNFNHSSGKLQNLLKFLHKAGLPSMRSGYYTVHYYSSFKIPN